MRKIPALMPDEETIQEWKQKAQMSRWGVLHTPEESALLPADTKEEKELKIRAQKRWYNTLYKWRKKQAAIAIGDIINAWRDAWRDVPAEQRTLAQAPERVRELVERLRRNRRLRANVLAELLERQGGHCALQLETCASIAVNYRPLTWSEVQVDHLLAVALGGKDDISNLQAVCPNCHYAKTAQDMQKICGPCGPPAKRARAE